MKNFIRVARAIALAGVLSSLAHTSFAAEVSGVKLPDVERIANQDLKLNGAGIRYKAVFKVYVAALYLGDRKTTVPDVLAAGGAKRVTLVMLRDVGNEELGQAFMNGIQKNSDKAERTKIIVQLMKFGELFASIPEIKKGDALTADWLPGSGTLIQLNGKKISEIIPDAMFYNVFLKIWLGEKPADTALKRHLLGEKEDVAVNAF